MKEVPEDRCGFTIPDDDLPFDLGGFCCWRQVWQESEKCILHADASEKPVDELKEALARRPERLDGAIFHGNVAGWELSLSDCVLFDADFSNSYLIGVDFSGATLVRADLSSSVGGASFAGADLTMADFSEATPAGGDFQDALLLGTDFSGATLNKAHFQGTKLSKTDLSNADLTEADLSGADVWDGTLENANLHSTDLSNAVLGQADLSEADLWDADFSEATLLKANLTNTDAQLTYFENAELSEADFTDSNLEDADFTDADARGATFDDSNLEDATFIRTELRDANLRDTRLYQTLFSDTRINSNTDFGEKSAYEDPDTELGENYEDTSRWEAAAWVYRRLQNLHEENAMSEQARDYHVRKEEAHRSDYWEKGQYFQWFVYTLNLYLTNHGESVKRVVYWSVGTILACALAYPFTGGIATGNEVFRATSLSVLSLGFLLRSLYFSTVTFTTLGYGDYHPVGEVSKALAGVESLAGALLVALFVFVLGRRVAR
jgi:uncharacterized protein YjbI with pentapeptide repeats